MVDNYWDKLMETDEIAGEYMLSYGEGPGAETRRQLGHFIKDGETVLDVGCGPGWNLDHFADHGPKIKRYLGLDYSHRFVDGAIRRVVGKINRIYESGIELGNEPPFKLGDVRKIDQPDSSWDVVIMQDVLEHTQGYEGPIKEAMRVCKKRAIFTFWHLTENQDQINDDGDDGYGAWYSQGKLETYLDSLDYHWLHHRFDYPKEPPRQRDFYIVDKEVKHGR